MIRPSSPHLLVAALPYLLVGCPEQKDSRPDAAVTAPRTATPALQVRDITFAGPAGHRPDRNFSRGERVICLATISNYTHLHHRTDLTADVRVTGPDGSKQTVLIEKGLKVTQGDAPTLRPGQIRAAITLQMTPAAPAGRYAVLLEIHDRLAKRDGRAEASFTLMGTPPPQVARFALGRVALAADDKMPAGSVAPVALEARGFATRAQRDGQHAIELAAETRVLDRAGKQVATQRDRLVRTTLPFAPAAMPLVLGVQLPRTLAPGRYTLQLTAHDRVGNAQAQAELALEIVPRKFGIYNVHLNDPASLPRRSFRLGEALRVRFAVHGFELAKDGNARLAVDIGVAGPDGGVYLAHKDVARTTPELARAFAASGRHPVQLPLTLPAIAPLGFYRLVIRARDDVAKREVTREYRLRLTGSAIAPLSTFTIDELTVRVRPDLPTIKGDAFVEGQRYHLLLRVGGAKLRGAGKLTHEADIVGGLTLRDLTGKLVHQSERLFRYQRTLHYRPLRIVIAAPWTVPAGLRPGSYTLQLKALNRIDQMVSQLTRRVTILSGGHIAAAPVP